MSQSKEEKHYVFASRVTTIILMVVSVFVTMFITRISGAWEFILECGAGLGLVLILRWFWWRINAWSEISAMITPFLILPIVRYVGISFPDSLFFLVGITTIVWLTVTYLTKPTDNEVLVSFYKKIHPGGVLWRQISDTLPEVKSDSGFGIMFVNWISGVVLVYSLLFGVGNLILSDYLEAIIFIGVGILAGSIIFYNLYKMEWSKTGN
jgi:hypothetical protein